MEEIRRFKAKYSMRQLIRSTFRKFVGQIELTREVKEINEILQW